MLRTRVLKQLLVQGQIGDHFAQFPPTRAGIPEEAHPRDRAESHMRYGYRQITVLLRREGWKVNVKRVHRPIDWKACKCGSNRRTGG